MDKELLKLLPQKAFKLLSLNETFRIGEKITKSRFDKTSYDVQVQSRLTSWKLSEVKIVSEFPSPRKSVSSKEDGEKILKIYFSQFFEKELSVHIDLRETSFSSTDYFYWIPSRFHYQFKKTFSEGVCSLYKGFYFENKSDFEYGLMCLGITNTSMNEKQKSDILDLFYEHFGEGQTLTVKFSLKKLQESFNKIFTYFFKEDIPLNPEFAVLGINLVTLYLTLEDIPYELNVREAFIEVYEKHSRL